MTKVALIQADCLRAMEAIPDRSVNLVLCDLPYGTTQNSWDSVIPLDKLWRAYERILAPQGAVVLTGQGPFTARLMISNEDWFKYKLVWEKSKPSNFLNAKKQPLRKHEDICVFYPRQPKYQPQMGAGAAYDKGVRKDQLTGSYGDFRPAHIKSEGGRYPTDVIYHKTAESEGMVYHATQKPVGLGQYLIRTYTEAGDVRIWLGQLPGCCRARRPQCHRDRTQRGCEAIPQRGGGPDRRGPHAPFSHPRLRHYSQPDQSCP